ncbi:hypothetical protein [Micromonospora arborensis]|uniref:hypothetical protein n=1 Tax=Micromonospora arborensis TaxID=2116518 RepID=UPI00370FB1C1
MPTEPQRCYRAVPGHLRVEQSDDAGTTWRVAWEVSDARREPRARRFDNPGDIGRHFASRDLIVYPAADGGHQVLVANGRDGFLRRGSDGGWRRVGFLEGWGPADTRWGDLSVRDSGEPGGRQIDLFLAIALALTLGVTVTVLAAHLAIRRSGGPRGWGTAGFGVMLTAGILLALVWERDDDFDTFDALVFVVLPACVVTAVTLLVRASYQGALPRWVGGALGGLLLTVVLAGLPLVGWLLGIPPQTRFALALALLGTVPGVLLAIRIAGLVDPARAYANRYPPRPPHPHGPYPRGLPVVPDPPYPNASNPPGLPVVPDPPYPNASNPPGLPVVPDPPYPNASNPPRPPAAPDPPSPVRLRPPYPAQLPPG